MSNQPNTIEKPTPIKRKAGGRKGIGVKAKAFAEEWVKTKNGVQSALATYDTDDYNTAGAIASENLKKPKVKDYIQSLLDSQITDEELTALHVRNAKQTESLPTSQKAIESLEVLKGLAKVEQTKPTNQTVNVFIQAVQNQVKDFEQTLKEQFYAQKTKTDSD